MGFGPFDNMREPSQSPWLRNQPMLVPSLRLMLSETTDQLDFAVAVLVEPADRGTKSRPIKGKREQLYYTINEESQVFLGFRFGMH